MSYPAWLQAIRTWVRAALAPFDTPAPTPPDETPLAHTIEVIYADQDAPRPKLPYASVLPIQSQPLGVGQPMSADEIDGDDITRTEWEWVEGTVSVGIYGPNHSDLADALALSLSDDALRIDLAEASVVIGNEESRIHMGRVSGRTVEDRTIIDFRYRRAASRTRTITPTIEHAATTLQIIDESGEPIGEPIDITLPPED